jgi:putative FmdB family regulatory protein
MPTYGYECKSCGHTFDVFQSMSDAPVKICPQCGREVRRLINGGTGIIFKGSGFYVTDKGKGKPVSGSSAQGKEKNESPQTENSSPSSTPAAAESAAKAPEASGPKAQPAAVHPQHETSQTKKAAG